jgi:hypothetical protein
MSYDRNHDYRHSSPNDLRCKSRVVNRAILLGSCAIGALPTFEKQCESASSGGLDFFNFNHGCFLPERSPVEIADYQFQIIQIPLRIVLSEHVWMRTSGSDDAFEKIFRDAVEMLD